jgi:tRNA-modifying protein YgfZ
LIEEFNPLEAGMGWVCADNKGCYTGQEIIARQVTYDKVTKTLTGLRTRQVVAVGSEVTVAGRNVGVVTSSALSPALNSAVALAVLKRPHNQPGTAVQIEGEEAEVLSLPIIA